MTEAVKSVNSSNFITDWPNRRIVPPTVKYALRETEIHFQHSSIVEHMRAALDAFFTPAELAREAERRNSHRLVRMPVYTEVYYRNKLLHLRYSRDQMPGSVESIICYQRNEQQWKYTGFIILKCYKPLVAVAKQEGWEYGVFVNRNGPTRNPDFQIACSQSAILITAPFGGISEEELRRRFKLGAPQKPQIAKTRY